MTKQTKTPEYDIGYKQGYLVGKRHGKTECRRLLSKDFLFKISKYAHSHFRKEEAEMMVAVFKMKYEVRE